MKGRETLLTDLETERDELTQKYFRLGMFIEGEYFPSLGEEDQELLKEQFSVMHEYLDVLDKRIERIGTLH